MEIDYKNSKIRKLCTDERYVFRQLGSSRAQLLWKRLGEIRAAENLEILSQVPGPRLHWLKGAQSHQLSIDLDHPRRLIIEPVDATSKELTEIKRVVIIGIKDTHQ